MAGKMKNTLIALTGMAFPGLGHLILGRKGRAALFFVLLSALFYSGVFLERDFYTKFGKGMLRSAEEQPLAMRDRDELEGYVDRAWKVIFVYAYPFFVGFGNYVVGLKWSDMMAPYITHVPGVLKADEVPVTTRDIGYCFALLAGLLNLLVMMDTYDIACNLDELKERKKE